MRRSNRITPRIYKGTYIIIFLVPLSGLATTLLKSTKKRERIRPVLKTHPRAIEKSADVPRYNEIRLASFD